MSLMAQGSQFAGSSAAPVPCQPSLASVGDYVTLMKPRVMSLVVFTALVSVMIAPGHIHPVIGFTALLCIAVGAGAAGALNMWYDADIDALMSRTSSRPIPRGRMAAGEALAFGVVLAAFAVGVLGVLVSWLAAALLAFTIFFYIVVYTAWLKRSTPYNIVIGGAAGSLPPVIGWAAATGASPSNHVSSSSSFSSGRRRIFGRCRSFEPRITPALAFPCSQSLPAQRKRGGRFCVIPSCSCRSARPHGF